MNIIDIISNFFVHVYTFWLARFTNTNGLVFLLWSNLPYKLTLKSILEIDFDI